MIARRDIAVLDTNIFVSAVLFKTATPRLALEQAFTHGIVLTSSATRNELRDVLSRPKFDRYMSSPRRMADIEDLILDTRHVVVSHRFQVCRHPADDKFLDLAVAGGADVIVTGDRDLLALHPFQSIAILTPADYLALGKQQRAYT